MNKMYNLVHIKLDKLKKNILFHKHPSPIIKPLANFGYTISYKHLHNKTHNEYNVFRRYYLDSLGKLLLLKGKTNISMCIKYVGIQLFHFY